MEYFSVHKFYHLIGQLKLLSRVKVGDKISFKSNLIIQSDLWYGPILRYLLDENRRNMIEELQNMRSDAKIFSNQIPIEYNLSTSDMTRYLKELLNSIYDARNGISNLIKTYSDDIATYQALKEMDEKFNQITIMINLKIQSITTTTTTNSQPINSNKLTPQSSYSYSYSAPDNLKHHNDVIISFPDDFDPATLGIEKRKEEKEEKEEERSLYYSTELSSNS